MTISVKEIPTTTYKMAEDSYEMVCTHDVTFVDHADSLMMSLHGAIAMPVSEAVEVCAGCNAQYNNIEGVWNAS